MRVWRWSTAVPPGELSKRAKPWTPEEIRVIRTLIQSGCSVAEIARELKRTEAAVRYKARLHGVRLVADEAMPA